MAIELPKGYVAPKPTEEIDYTNVANQNEPDPGMQDVIAAVPDEDSEFVEFPSVPEVTEMGDDAPGFFESLAPNFKTMMTSDDLGKTEILQKAFKDDKRWGGAFVDKFGLPMIVWNKTPYYINKPGFTTQDFNTFLGEVLKYVPASRYVSGAKTLKGTISKGIGAYGLTETATKIGEGQITPKTVAQRDRDLTDVAGEVGALTALGVGADVAIPPVAKPIVEGAKTAIRTVTKKGGQLAETVGETIFPKFDPEILQESKFPLTRGQKTAEIPEGPTPRSTAQTGIEDELRRAQDSGLGTNIIRGFDDQQLALIRKDASDLQAEIGANTIGRDGLYGNIPSAAAEETQSIISGRAAKLKEESGELYQELLEIPSPPMMTAEGVGTVSRNMLDIPPSMGVTGRQLENMPILKSEITNLQRISKAAANPKFKDQALNTLNSYQKSLGVAARTAQQGSPEQAVLLRMKSQLDDSIFDGIEQGFIKGDQAVIDQLRNATGLYRRYAGLSGRLSAKNNQQRAANKILSSLSDNDYTPMQVTNLLFGHNKFAPSQAVPLVLKELQKSLPSSEYDQVIRLMKDGILTKAFAGTGGDITRTAIVKNFNDVFNNQRAITDKLFSPEEISRIRQFRKDVMPTLWAEIKDNPSGTSYKILSSLSRQGLLNFPGIPIAGQLVRSAAPTVLKGLEEAAQATQAIDAVKQTLDRFQAPLLSNSAQSSIRPQLREESDADEGLRDLPDSDREKIKETIEGLQQTMTSDDSATSELSSIMPPVTSTDIFEDDLSGQPMAQLGINPATSPTILPSEIDREIAMRMQMQDRKGIAGLG